MTQRSEWEYIMAISDVKVIEVLSVLGELLDSRKITADAYDKISDALLGTDESKQLSYSEKIEWEKGHRDGC